MFFLFIYIFMAFFHKPAWCEDEKYNVWFLLIFFYFITFFKDYCTGIKNHDEEFIITSRIPYLSHLTFSIIECLIMIFLILNKVLELNYRNDKKFQIRFWVLFALFIITMISDIVWNFYDVSFQVNLFIRPIFLSLYQYLLFLLYKYE